MFIPPKTNWKFDDEFDLYEDYFRIKNNILELRRLISRLYKPFQTIEMKDYGIDGTGFADFFNNVERNIDLLADHGFRNPDMPSTATWKGNEPPWTYADANRIEGCLLMIYNDLMSQQKNMRKISFVVGGSDFEQTI